MEEHDRKAWRLSIEGTALGWAAWMAGRAGLGWLGVLCTFLALTCGAAAFWHWVDWRQERQMAAALRRRHIEQMTPEALAKEQEITAMRLRQRILELVREIPKEKLERVQLAEYLVVEAHLSDHGNVLERVRALDGEWYFRSDIVRVLANCYQDNQDRWRLPPQHGLPDNLYRMAVQDVTRRLMRMDLAYQERPNGPTFLRLPPAACGERLGVKYDEVERYVERVMA